MCVAVMRSLRAIAWLSMAATTPVRRDYYVATRIRCDHSGVVNAPLPWRNERCMVRTCRPETQNAKESLAYANAGDHASHHDARHPDCGCRRSGGTRSSECRPTERRTHRSGIVPSVDLLGYGDGRYHPRRGDRETRQSAAAVTTRQLLSLPNLDAPVRQHLGVPGVRSRPRFPLTSPVERSDR